MSRWTLEVESAQAPRTVRELDRERVIVGRGTECDVQVPDLRVSRQHLCLELRADGPWAVDLGSRAGTRLNGKPLLQATHLAHGDVLALSEETRVVLRAAAEPTFSDLSTPSKTLFRDAAAILAQRDEIQPAASAVELRRQAEQLHLLNEVHRALAGSPSRDALLEMILDRVFGSLRPEQAAVLLLDPAGELVHSVTRPADLRPEEVFFSHSLAREVTHRRQAALVLDASTDARFAAAASVLGAGVQSVLAAPLLVPDGALGMIVLSSRVQRRQFGEDDLELLVSLASVAALHLRNLALVDEAVERRRLIHELELARRIQLALLPARLPPTEGYEILAGNLPSRGVSGDLYTAAFDVEHRLLTCLVFDVSGKGMAASLLGASLEALSAGPIEVGLSPDELCRRVSRRLFARTPPEKYATGFVAQLDPRQHRLTWANAGHNPALLLRRGGEIERLAATGPPLGLLLAASFRAETTSLAPGDLVLVYTDGITEAADPTDEEFGLPRLEAIVRRQGAEPLAAVRAAIERALDDFVRGVPYADDRTLLFLRRLPD